MSNSSPRPRLGNNNNKKKNPLLNYTTSSSPRPRFNRKTSKKKTFCPNLTRTFNDQIWLFSVKKGGYLIFQKALINIFQNSLCLSLWPLFKICVINICSWSNFLYLWPFLLSQSAPKIIKNFTKFHANINNAYSS